MKNITIVNGWHDLNTGDSAIIISMIKQINKKIKNFKVNIISELNSENEYYENSIDYIKDSFSKIEINLVEACFRKKYSGICLKEIFDLVKNFIILCLPKKLVKFLLKHNEYYITINSSDAILSKGGHFIFDRNGFKGLIHLYKCLYPMLLAHKLGKKYFIISQSIGPLYDKSRNVFSKISFKLSYYVLKNADAISLRETVSFNNLKKLGLNNINNTGDYAFMLDNENKLPDELNKIINKNDFVVITVRQHNFKRNTETNYLNTIEKIANYVNKKYSYNVVFMAHVKGPNKFEDDRIVVENIKNKFVNPNFIFLTDQYSPQVICKFYSYAKLMIGTRFHSVIFALSNCVPAIAISYSGYKANIMKQFNLDDFMIDIEDVNIDNENKIECMIDKLLDKKLDYKNIIKKCKKDVVNSIEDDFSLNKALGINYGEK